MNWINTINPTNLKVVLGCFIVGFACIGALVANWLGHTTDLGLFAEVMGGGLAAMGIAYLSRSKDRTTDYGYLERQADIERAKASAAPTVTSAGMVVQQATPGATP